MKLPAVVISDLHLTANPDHEYRWGLFDWLKEELRKANAKTLLILGDLTDAKDFHSSALVNRLVHTIHQLTHYVDEVIILKGNHDVLRDSDFPFFSFLNVVPKVRFIYCAVGDPGPSVACLFLPHTKDVRTWQPWNFRHYDFVFMHQTVNGAIASNGERMGGELAGDMDDKPVIQVYSGDIHVPQDIGAVRYVGSPYHVHFGDKFVPRCIVLDREGRESSIYYKTISRVMVRGTYDDVVDQLRTLKHGDQIKVSLDLPSSDRSSWLQLKSSVKGLCADLGLSLNEVSIVPRVHRRIVLQRADRVATNSSPERVVTEFVKQEDLGGDVLDAGLTLMQP